MTDSSADDKKEETKPVLGFPHSEQFPQSDHNFAPPYSNSGYHYPPPYDQYPYQYPQPFYYYPNCQPNYYNDDNNNNIPQPQLSNVAPPKRKIITFCRVFFCLIVVLILSVIIYLVVQWWTRYAWYPDFEVASFVVHSFNISNYHKLTADWEIDVNVINPNKKVEISFEYIATSLEYKFQLLQSSFSVPINVARKSNAKFHVDFDIPNLNQKNIGGLVVKDMARDRRKGHNLLIDLRIEGIIMNIPNNGSPKRTVEVRCENLMLKFKNSSSLPEWVGSIKKYKHECDYEDNWWDYIW
ncbi:uncharacterized protein LOC132050855 [Lycium ferocissimum]|uniref:uncharacterized protein LOC132050855 n=1 Tax=Lycium ferocissimum TaxID=112874 RepID=UPI0028160BF6|nr:uncharacterized protein LOC132050855 [Lycium ferocissimum]